MVHASKRRVAFEPANKRQGAYAPVEKDQKVLVVLVPDAVVDPGAMMVKLEHAGVADGTMVAPVRLYHVAIPACHAMHGWGHECQTKRATIGLNTKVKPDHLIALHS